MSAPLIVGPRQAMMSKAQVRCLSSLRLRMMGHKKVPVIRLKQVELNQLVALRLLSLEKRNGKTVDLKVTPEGLLFLSISFIIPNLVTLFVRQS